MMLSFLRRQESIINWIPACAGMTEMVKSKEAAVAASVFVCLLVANDSIKNSKIETSCITYVLLTMELVCISEFTNASLSSSI